ncbi:MAG TPA: hypothetical protein VKF63_02775 [Terracidiphilus sp.]|nr:hypothetical protein [Terracidiphilus sp.]
MTQLDVLNPTPTHPLNPDYGWQRKRPLTHITTKANAGPAYFREITDVMHQFMLNWADRMPNHVAELKRYYEQYRDGFFTLIDHEAGGREYVGRFTNSVDPIPISHNHWTVQQVVFEEIPGAPMRNYPNRWDKDAIWRYCLSDFQELTVAANPAANWVLLSGSGYPGGTILWDVTGTANDTATAAYVGYGFQYWAPTNVDHGIFELWLDGQWATGGRIDGYSASPVPSVMLAQVLNVQLGLHVVQVKAPHLKNASATGYGVAWGALRVMR